MSRACRTILLLTLVISSAGHAEAAAKVWATDKACPALQPAVAAINRAPFPDGWTLIVACTETQWEMLQRKADAQATRHAFTNLRGRITVLHGAMFLNATVTRPVHRILLHEIGHIECNCGDEDSAEHWALAHERSHYGPAIARAH